MRMPSHACSRMNRIESATIGSVIAMTSVDCRVAIPTGRDRAGRRWFRLALHHVIQELGGFVADTSAVGDDA